MYAYLSVSIHMTPLSTLYTLHISDFYSKWLISNIQVFSKTTNN